MRVLFAAIVFLKVAFAVPTFAANIVHLTERNDFGCDIELTGAIEAGDAEALAVLQEKIWPGESGANEGPGDGGVLCLRGPGGSLAEAIKMARIRNGPTIVPPNETCQSACAVLFMAGNINQSPYRVMYPSSRLGFHAPALVVKEGEFSATNVSRAYDVAIRTIAEVSALNILPPSALTIFSSTPSSEMHYISTFRELIEIEVGLVQPAPSNDYRHRTGWAALPNITLEKMFLNICQSYYRKEHYGRDPIFRPTNPVQVDHVEYQPDSYSKKFVATGSVYIHQAEEYYENCKVEATISDSFDRVSLWGSLDYGGDTASFGNLQAWPDSVRFAEAATLSVAFEEFFKYVNATEGEEALYRCAFDQTSAVVTNVNEFVNIRNGASLQAQIVVKANLGETLTLLEPNSWWYNDTPRGRQCSKLCQAAAEDTSDNQARAQLRGCIEDAEIWQKVRNDLGRVGFVSTYFLRPAQ